jgi:dihydroxyacetone kinase
VAFVLNDPADFVDEAVRGFALAHASVVRVVPGGVVRRTQPANGSVAVVIGGGSGHYPAFAGLVGDGLARGAVLGNVFASPSTDQVVSVVRACESGGGVLLSYGNYAGDVLNFDAAQDGFRAAGIDCRTVVVTDDIASAPSDETERRRGVAGDLVVFKIAGSAADAGLELDAVERVARAANAATRTLGVAFSGCTLPGSSAPLFTVPAGRMGVGMGIHGEPGLSEDDLLPADPLAELLVSRLLAERPPGSPARAVVLLNGLGGVKEEELYLLYGAVHTELADGGIEVVAPEVGELVTSFEMAGVSLTLAWLDDELLDLWTRPSRTPAYRRHALDWRPSSAPDAGAVEHREQLKARSAVGSSVSRAAAAQVVAGLTAATTELVRMSDELGRLDGVAGDGDHGIGMLRGARAGTVAASAEAAAGAGVRTVLAAAASAWADRAGGTSGALWGHLLGAAAKTLDDSSPVGASAVVAAVTAADGAVRLAGGAAPGDKTMVDALHPFATRLRIEVDGGTDLGSAWQMAAADARTAAEATAKLVACIGRARTHGERSRGTPDPGAVSFAAVVNAVHPTTGTDEESR